MMFITLTFVLIIIFPYKVQAASLPDQHQCRTLWEQQLPVKPVIEGWCLFIDSNRGNCLACHDIRIDGVPGHIAVAGNVGPALENLSSSYPDRNDLRRLIYDASGKFPGTIMPPFGRNQILSGGEIDLIVKFLLGI